MLGQIGCSLFLQYNVILFVVVGIFGTALGGSDQGLWYYPDQRELAGGGPTARLSAEHTFSFIVMGDTCSGIDVFKQNLDEINLLDPDLVLDLGDLIPGGLGKTRE